VTHRRLTFGITAVATLLTVTTVGAITAVAEAGEVGADGAGVAASDPAAVVLLMSAVRAQRARNYSGTEMVAAWSAGAAATSVVDVEHRAGAGTLVAVQPSATTPGWTVEEPEQVSQPTSVDPLAVAVVDGGPLDLLRRNYVLSMGGVDGSAVRVLAHRPGGSIAATFWIDRRSGLPVRRQIYDTSGRLIRASAFVELHLSPRARASTTSTPVLATATAETTVPRAEVGALRQAGWDLPAQLPAGMVLYDVREQGTGAGRIVHLSYSDGLSTVSVFVQRGRLATKSVAKWTREKMGGAVYVHDYGLGRRVVWNGRGRVYTLVADAPITAVAAIVAVLPHGERHRGAWGRVKHGLQRVGSWLNPFG
jgi:sigma-E factor negative regulatory protein RseB